MQRMLGLPVQGGRQGRLFDYEQMRLLDETLAYREQHGVSEDAWEEHVRVHQHEAGAFILNGGSFPGPDTDVPPLSHGLLAHPIGGVFNLSSEASRQEAYEWAYRARSAWTPAKLEDDFNYAIFDIGPGADVDVVRGAALLDALTEADPDLAESGLELRMVEEERHQFLLAKIIDAGIARNEGAFLPRRENPLFRCRFQFLRQQDVAMGDVIMIDD